MGDGGVKPIGPAPNAIPALQQQIDETKLKAALAGVRDPKASGRSVKDPAIERGRLLIRNQQEMEAEVGENRKALDQMNRDDLEYTAAREKLVNAWGDQVAGMTNDEILEWQKAKFAAIDAADEVLDASARMAAGFTEDGKAIVENTKALDSAAHRLGMTFSSAFENMIFDAGRSVKALDLVKAAVTDVSRALFRNLITEPAAKGIEGYVRDSGGVGGIIRGLFGGGGGPSAMGYGTADVTTSGIVGSFDVGTPFVPRTGLAMVHQGERIIPASQNGGGDSPPVSISIYAPGADPYQLGQLQIKVDALARDIRAGASVSDVQRRSARSR
jgi:hypothetical protein